jgi:uncharacterized membrane protein
MKPSDHHIIMQQVIGKLLRTGVFVSASLVIWGGFWYLMQQGHQFPLLTTFHGEPEPLTHIVSIFTQALQGQSQAIIQAGLLVLIFTPIARVLLSVLLFALEKDTLYVVITLIVLSILLYSLTGNTAL